MSTDHPQSEWKQEIQNDDKAIASRAFQQQTLNAVSKALHQAGFDVAIAITGSDRLQAAILEAQFFLDRENEREARKVLMEVLKR